MKKSNKISNFMDFLKENNVEEIIPMGKYDSKFGVSNNEKIEMIKDFIDTADDDVIETIINILREVLLEMEQQGFIDEETTDNLDDEYDGDWIGWIKAVIEIDEFPEEGLNNVYEVIYNIKSGDDRGVLDFEDEDVECPDCEGTGQDSQGEDCERCDGSGRVYRPDDIPPDDFNYKYDDDF
jgi:hypothetical protein